MAASDTAWDMQLALLDFLEGNWREPDLSLWEVRGEPRHFVHSKALAWAGVDRAVRSVPHHGHRGPVDRWEELRDRIHREVCEHGFDAERNTFTQFYGSKGVDAALLLLPRVGFLPWRDPRIRGTVDTVRRELDEDGFLRRYLPEADGGVDGLPGPEATFLVCTFWLVDALHGTGRRQEAWNCSSGCWTCATTWGCSRSSTTRPRAATSATRRRRSAWSASSTARCGSAARRTSPAWTDGTPTPETSPGPPHPPHTAAPRATDAVEPRGRP